MRFSVAIAAEKDTNIELALNPAPRPRISFQSDPEVFTALVMERQRLDAPIVSANRTSTTLIGNCHLLERFPSTSYKEIVLAVFTTELTLSSSQRLFTPVPNARFHSGMLHH
jgi:hypothetical protein